MFESNPPPLPPSTPPDVPPFPSGAEAVTPPAALQFDRAEYAQPGSDVTCASCSQAIALEYYELNGKVICGTCRAQVQPIAVSGTSLTRFVRALFAGTAAAI